MTLHYQFSDSPPYYYISSSDNFDKQPQGIFDQFGEAVDSSMKWAVVESVVSGLVVIIAIIAIVYAIIECLKKAGTAMSTYTQIPTTEKYNQISSNSNSSEIEVVIPTDSKSEFPTIERILSNINKEKPMRFTPQKLYEITNNYSTILGSGAFGVVFKGQLSNGENVAVKVLNSLEIGILEEQFKSEVSTIGRTYHNNLVKLYGFCFHHDTKALVYEYVENGSLDKYLFGTKNRDNIDFLKLFEIVIGMAKGIAYLHEECEHRIIHYDIKPENILLDMKLVAKIADFGLAKLRSRESNNIVMNTHFRGTIGYAAPEMWKAYPVTYKCDVYSFGIVLFEIVGKRRHFDSSYSESQEWFPKWTWEMFKNNELNVMVALCGIEEKYVEIGKRMLKVALWCVQYLPDDRPSMSTIVKMLEGEIDISPPPFPFHNLNPPPKENVTLEGSIGDSDTASSSWHTESLREFGSKMKQNTFQIENST